MATVDLTVRGEIELLIETQLAGLLSTSGEYYESIYAYHRCLEMAVQRFGTGSMWAILTNLNMAEVLFSAGFRQESLNRVREMAKISADIYGEDHLFTFYCQLKLGTFLYRCSDYEEALTILTPILPRALNVIGFRRSVHVCTIANMAHGYTGRPWQAFTSQRRLYRECLLQLGWRASETRFALKAVAITGWRFARVMNPPRIRLVWLVRQAALEARLVWATELRSASQRFRVRSRD